MHCVFWVWGAVCFSDWQCTQWLKHCTFEHFSFGCDPVVNSWFFLRAISWKLVSFSLFWFIWTNDLLKQKKPSCNIEATSTKRSGSVSSLQGLHPSRKMIPFTVFSRSWCLGIWSPELAPNAPFVASGKVYRVQDWFPLVGGAGRCWEQTPHTGLHNCGAAVTCSGKQK